MNTSIEAKAVAVFVAVAVAVAVFVAARSVSEYAISLPSKLMEGGATN